MEDIAKLYLLNGFPVPTEITQEVLDKLKNFQLYSDDVWVVTYPKCGTTWTQQIVKLIRSNGVQDDVHIRDSVPWMEFDFEKGKNIPRPRAFKSHYPYDTFPCGPPHTTPCKYIYVARNPKDVATSFYYHTKATSFPDINREFFLDKLLAGELEFGDYFDHLLGWLPHRNDENVLFLKYEDIKKNLPQAVATIATFIQVDLSEEVIAKIADMTTFDKMKETPLAAYRWSDARKQRSGMDFMRKGKVGDWKNFLTADQSARIDAVGAEKLKDTGLEFEYEI